jgi:polyphosphate glucokinase
MRNTLAQLNLSKCSNEMTYNRGQGNMTSRSSITTDPIVGENPSKNSAYTQILTVDIGGTNVKIMASGETEPRKYPSRKSLTPTKLVEIIRKMAEGWDYQAISIGYPGLVGDHGPSSEPLNLGSGWVGFDFPSALGLPVRIINDAAMQALGSYESGRMLFLGLGTGLGSALISEQTILTLELGQLLCGSKKTLGDVLSRQGLKRFGKTVWRQTIIDVVPTLMKAFHADSVVLGGGNAKYVKELPPGVRLGHNLTAFRGGFRLWNMNMEITQSATDKDEIVQSPVEWKLL